MFGPIEGRRHDAFMLGVSGLTNKLSRFQTPTGEPCILYGDPAYGLARNIIGPFRGAHIADDEQPLNTEMSKVRTCVEWGFGKICLNFAYLDFKKSLKGVAAACWEVLLRGKYLNQLSCLPVWVINQHMF